MKIQVSLLVAATILLGAGCIPHERTRSIESKFPISDSYTPGRIKREPVACAGSGECVIDISIDSNKKCDVENINLEDFVSLGDKQNSILWRLPDGYRFCPRAGDGVFLKNPNVPDDLFEPVPPSKCEPTFKWTRLKPDGMDYEYLLRFRKGKEICGVKDPWMRN